jgi:hypothetical protein
MGVLSANLKGTGDAKTGRRRLTPFQGFRGVGIFFWASGGSIEGWMDCAFHGWDWGDRPAWSIGVLPVRTSVLAAGVAFVAD